MNISVITPDKLPFFNQRIRILYEGLKNHAEIKVEKFSLKKRDFLKRFFFKPKNYVYWVFHPEYVKYTKFAVVDYDDPLSQIDQNFIKCEVENFNKKQVAYVVTSTIQLKKYLISIGVDESKLRIVPTPVDCKLFHPLENDDGNTVGYLGILNGMKGNRLNFIKSIVENLSSNIRFVTNYEAFKKLPKKSNVQSLSSVPPHSKKLVDYVNMLSIGLTYVDNKRFSAKIVQYMACEKPVIANNSPENKFILDAHAGFLVNSAEEAVEQVILLLEDERLRKKMGANGRRYVQNYHDKFKLASDYLKIFHKAEEKCLGQKS